MKLYFRKNGVTKRLNTITVEAGGGHTIIDAEGNTMPQEFAMQFVDSHVTDDSTNGKTVVENVKEVDPADYASTTDEGIIVTDDGDDALIGPVSDDKVEVIADGEKNIKTLLDELYLKLDLTKINEKSVLKYEDVTSTQYYYLFEKSSGLVFVLSYVYPGHTVLEAIRIQSGSSAKRDSDNGTVTDVSTTLIPSNGTKITLYYGNKKATVDLQTKANRCLYDSNTTVKQKIDANDASVIKHHPSLPMIYLGYDSNGHRLLVYNSELEFIGSIPVNVGS